MFFVASWYGVRGKYDIINKNVSVVEKSSAGKYYESRKLRKYGF